MNDLIELYGIEKVPEIMDKINKGEGSMGLLVNNKGLYEHLDSAAVNINKLVSDLNTHPKRYVHFSIFGKKDKSLNGK